MSTTDDRETIAKLAAALAQSQANTAKMQAEIETLRSRIWDRRQTIPGRLNDSIIDKAIKQARKDGKRKQMSDGGGLQLNIFPNPYRGLIVSWMFRWTDTISKANYKPRSLGLGSLNETPLPKARAEALQCREWLREGKDPKNERKLAAHKDEDTFRTVAELLDEYLETKVKPASKKHYDQTKQRFRDFVLPFIGAMPCQSVTLKIFKEQVLQRNAKNPTEDTDDIWTRKHVVAKETRRHAEHAFKFGIRHGYRTGDNPAKWVDGLKDMLPKPSSVHKVTHHPSLNFRKLPEFVQLVRAFRYDRPWPITGTDRPIVSYAIEFLLLFGGRSGELLKAQWKEFDRKEKTWTIPAKHTKSGKARSVPITDTMLIILNEMERLRFDQSPDALVFFSVKSKPDEQTRATNPIGSQTLMRILREHFKVEIHNHGWRSTLKDWCIGRGKKHCPAFTIEWWRMQCDHWEGVPRSDMAYGPDRLLEERHPLMQAYDDYATTPPTDTAIAATDTVVVPLKKRRAA